MSLKRLLNGAAQIIHEVGAKAHPRRLAKAAQAYENSAVRRLGYLLEHFGHQRHANALILLAQKAKSMKPLDPSVKPLATMIGDEREPHEQDTRWKLDLNESVEIDT